MHTQAAIAQMNADQQSVWLRRVLGAFALLLVAVTWPLWTASSRMPQIPWLSWLCGIPSFVDIVALALAVLGLLGLLLVPHSARLIRCSAVCFLIGWGVLLSLDQDRLQPWAWQYFILGCVIAFSDRSRISKSSQDVAPFTGTQNLNYWRWLTISIYIYSAVSKVDVSFLVTHGQLLLQGLFLPLGIHTDFWTAHTKQILAALLPVAELLVGLLLLWSKTRRWGCVASWVMHSLLIIALGPWGLNHEPGVLIWNAYFIVQNLFLFWMRDATPAQEIVRGKGFSERALQFLMVLVLAVPILESFGFWDHWPSWAVYCSRPEKVEVFINSTDLEQVPPNLKRYLGHPKPFSDEVPLNLDALSFDTRHCPLYPQDRYRLALTLAVLGSTSLREESVTVIVHSTPNRWTGHRTRKELQGLHSLALECETFFWNTRPRNY